MHRAGALLFVVAVAAALSSHVQAASVPSCAQAEVRVHDEAVFGHFASVAASKKLRTRAKAQGFNGLKLENEGCGDFELEIDGADRQADRASFTTEALKAGFEITYEQTAPPMQKHAGQVVGVFGRKPTVAAANTLMWKLAGAGFHFVDLVRQGSSWLVVMPQVPIKSALSIAHEASASGFHVQFQPGSR